MWEMPSSFSPSPPSLSTRWVPRWSPSALSCPWHSFSMGNTHSSTFLLECSTSKPANNLSLPFTQQLVGTSVLFPSEKTRILECWDHLEPTRWEMEVRLLLSALFGRCKGLTAQHYIFQKYNFKKILLSLYSADPFDTWTAGKTSN